MLQTGAMLHVVSNDVSVDGELEVAKCTLLF